MHRIGARGPRRRDELVDREIALRRGRRPQQRRLVGEQDVERFPVGLRVDGDGGDAHLAAGPDDPDGDLSAIGDEDFPEGRRHSARMISGEQRRRQRGTGARLLQRFHLRFRLLQPEAHVHLAVHRRRRGEVLAEPARCLPGPPVELRRGRRGSGRRAGACRAPRRVPGPRGSGLRPRSHRKHPHTAPRQGHVGSRPLHPAPAAHAPPRCPDGRPRPASLAAPGEQIRVAQKAEPHSPIGAVVGLGSDHGVFEQGDGVRRAPRQRVCPSQRGAIRNCHIQRCSLLCTGPIPCSNSGMTLLPSPRLTAHPGHREPGERVMDAAADSTSSTASFGHADGRIELSQLDQIQRLPRARGRAVEHERER